MESIAEDRTLTKNNLKNFIIRIDINEIENLPIIEIINSLSKYFDRTEKRIQSQVIMNFKAGGGTDLDKKDTEDYVLVSDSRKMNFTYTSIQNAFVLNSSSYKDNTVYKDIITSLIDDLKTKIPEIKAKRIGMRYINEYSCPKPNLIRKFFNKNIARSIFQISQNELISRVICQEEYNLNSSKIRIQYGIPNKYYPTVINNWDLLLDIDSYTDSEQELLTWTEIIRDLNHKAYSAFTKVINPDFLIQMK